MATEIDLHALIQQRLVALGQRYTSARRELVDALAGAGRPITLPELLAGSGGLSQSSAYRNLSVMEQAGAVRRLVHSAGHAHYELAEDLTGHHHHLICEDCGTIRDVTLDDGLERSLDQAFAGLDQRRGLRPPPPRARHLRQLRQLRRVTSQQAPQPRRFGPRTTATSIRPGVGSASEQPDASASEPAHSKVRPPNHSDVHTTRRRERQRAAGRERQRASEPRNLEGSAPEPQRRPHHPASGAPASSRTRAQRASPRTRRFGPRTTATSTPPGVGSASEQPDVSASEPANAAGRGPVRRGCCASRSRFRP